MKNNKLKLTRRSEQQAATVWINLISDFCSGYQKNSNNLDWLKGMQPKCNLGKFKHETMLVSGPHP